MGGSFRHRAGIITHIYRISIYMRRRVFLIFAEELSDITTLTTHRLRPVYYFCDGIFLEISDNESENSCSCTDPNCLSRMTS
jgi:hypothetical protein